MMRHLEARWTGNDDFVDVDFCATLDEAKSRAIEFQLDHNVRSLILWSVDDDDTHVVWGRNKFCTFRLRPI